MEKLKKCSKCGRELPVSEFWKNASTEDGLQTYCKAVSYTHLTLPTTPYV